MRLVTTSESSSEPEDAPPQPPPESELDEVPLTDLADSELENDPEDPETAITRVCEFLNVDRSAATVFQEDLPPLALPALACRVLCLIHIRAAPVYV